MLIFLLSAFVAVICAIDPSRILVSLTIDAHNNEIVYEGVRLLASLRKFGGLLNEAKLDVCVATRENYEHPLLIERLQAFNITYLRYSDRVEGPDFAKSLNKFCSFLTPHLEGIDYFLYLDDDIFIARDPVSLLSSYFDSSTPETTLLCGRPWNTFPNIEEYPEYIGNAESKFFNVDAGYELLETIAGGFTYYGMCNTGMYFIPAAVVRPLTETALKYLEKSVTTPHYRETIPFAPTYFGIDSIILWAAQYEMQTEVIVAPPALNYIASAEDHLYKFIPEIRNGPSSDGSAACTVDEFCDPTDNPFDNRTPALIHFSLGSSLGFTIDEGPTGVMECGLKMRAQMITTEPSLLKETMFRLFSGGENGRRNCDYFLSALADLPLDNEDSCVPVVNIVGSLD